MSLADTSYRLINSPATVELFAEAERQLNICNSCRYCEGYCAVYPALERRTVLTPGDITYLANLCHDCRACFYACMYAPPHEFGVNPPAILSEIRRLSYDEFTITHWLRVARGWLGNHRSDAGGLIFVALIVLAIVLVAAGTGLGVLVHRVSPAGSPYAVITYATIVSVSLCFFAAGCSAMVLGGLAYWRTTTGALAGLADVRAWSSALRDSASLRYLRGGQEGCYLQEDHPSAQRRVLHYLVAYGFSLCLLSTIVAAIEEDLLGQSVPFSVFSVPVIAGLAGGVGLLLGSVGLLYAKRSQDLAPTDAPMIARDRYFLYALFALGATGLATFGLRDSSIYGLVLALHLGTVWACFLCAPMTKFVHFVYRMLALVQDGLERRSERVG